MSSLVADYSDTSSSNSDSDSDNEYKTKNDSSSDAKKQVQQKLLPSANVVLAKETKTNGMVFSNPFLEAEVAKLATLEKHVKMVNNDDHLLLKNGRKICWNYRKGRCRFGTSCQYAHDSDLNEVNEQPSSSSSTAFKSTPTPTMSATFSDNKTTNTSRSVDGNAFKRSRPGLSNTIEPSKRVMKSYYKQTDHKLH